MATVRLKFDLDVNNPSERAALTELRKWKALLEGGQKEECLLKQRQTLMAGLYLQIAMPNLSEKLAQNLSSAGIDDFAHFYKNSGSALDKNVENDQQNEVLLRLDALQQILNDKQLTPIAAHSAELKTLVSPKLEIEAATSAPVDINSGTVSPIVSKEEALGDKLKKMSKIKAKKIF